MAKNSVGLVIAVRIRACHTEGPKNVVGGSQYPIHPRVAHVALIAGVAPTCGRLMASATRNRAARTQLFIPKERLAQDRLGGGDLILRRNRGRAEGRRRPLGESTNGQSKGQASDQRREACVGVLHQNGSEGA